MILLTKRLTIQPYSKTDFSDFKAILTNDIIMKGIRGKGYSTKVAKEKFKKALEENDRNKDLGFYNVTLKDTSNLVGFAKLVMMEDGNLEVGYALVQELWGQGYASEITAALIKHALEVFPEKEIIGIVNTANDASKKVLLKQNFILKNTGQLDGFEVAYYYLSK